LSDKKVALVLTSLPNNNKIVISSVFIVFTPFLESYRLTLVTVKNVSSIRSCVVGDE
jgi:hypothetical protein